MTFIKTLDGDYINAAQVKFFLVHSDNVIAAYTAPDQPHFIAKDFDSHEVAQQWLDELIEELESDDD